MVDTYVAYAGIGSRETPPKILDEMRSLAADLCRLGFVLRSGHADGADMAFEEGHVNAETKEIYLPYPLFNGSLSTLCEKPTRAALDLAARFHPAWHGLSTRAKLLHARNGYQMLGYGLRSPVAFVVCWTKGGRGEGGTGQALRIAQHLDIPVFDYGIYSPAAIRAGLREFMEIDSL